MDGWMDHRVGRPAGLAAAHFQHASGWKTKKFWSLHDRLHFRLMLMDECDAKLIDSLFQVIEFQISITGHDNRAE